MLTKAKRDASLAADRPDRPRLSVAEGDGVVECRLSGVWNTRSVADIDAQMRAIEAREDIATLRLDLAGLAHLDTAGAWLIERLMQRQGAAGARVELVNCPTAARVLLAAVEEATTRDDGAERGPAGFFVTRWLAALGKAVYAGRDDLLYNMHILGATVRGAQMKLGRRRAINMAAVVNQADRMGVGAIPVIVLMSAIVGAIIAQQGAFQLRYFGAEIFVVDLVGILILRELGVLMTAIMVAGRSGSAITAEIGSMKMREEVDALTVIGLNPIGVLVFPRLVALIIAVPCLTVLANFAALGGAMAVAWTYSGIAPSAFIDRLHSGIDMSTIMAGLIKAPFMAIIVGIIASAEGMKVGGSAESLGRHVTASVVKAIFVVIVVDGFFAMFYAAIDF
ncbi:ABC transporter permease [Aquibium sp. A9E412]|uniref:ABC transporter permease n=1 Tax=Aquibium sp. A9E412 TaxID=2976767 RepID=UPI0025B21D35|nr:ABC transporter permease [Aquibium sp. A9E412]MDN2567844.1 ABC transporter permease [Aquibium sp. A9E412]